MKRDGKNKIANRIAIFFHPWANAFFKYLLYKINMPFAPKRTVDVWCNVTVVESVLKGLFSANIL